MGVRNARLRFSNLFARPCSRSSCAGPHAESALTSEDPRQGAPLRRCDRCEQGIQVWAVGARFVLARRRVVRDIHHAVKAPEYFVASDSRNAARLVVSGSCAQSWLTNCESMVPIG